MRLSTAYQKLQWVTPVLYERAQLGGAPMPAFPRGIGTSGQMLLELYLDMHRVNRSSLHPPVQFLTLCLSANHARHLRNELSFIDRRLGLHVNLDFVRFWPYKNNVDHLRGDTWYSWAVFCDHAVKEVEGWRADRNTCPYSFARRVAPFGEHWTAYDRDGGLVGALTSRGKNELIDRATTPITVDVGAGLATTYAPTDIVDVVRLLRVRKAFER